MGVVIKLRTNVQLVFRVGIKTQKNAGRMKINDTKAEIKDQSVSFFENRSMFLDYKRWLSFVSKLLYNGKHSYY